MASTARAIGPQVAVYRLFDLAHEVDLGRLAVDRLRLLRARGGAVKFESPPAFLDLGVHAVAGVEGRLGARVYGFGVAALHWTVALGEALDWPDLQEAVDRITESAGLPGFFEEQVERLAGLLEAALVQPVAARLSEEFVVVHLRGVDPGLADEELEERPEVGALVLGEAGGELAGSVHRELAQYAFSYRRDDLAVLGFERVLIVDPEGIWDVADLVELAHAELIELADYDGLLRRELEVLPELLARRAGFFGRRYDRLRRRLMERHAEITEVRSRLRGALTITEDLFYAKVHRRAMSLYGATELAETLEARLRVLSEVYGMLTGEVNARRAEVLEAGILLLVLIEVLRALL